MKNRERYPNTEDALKAWHKHRDEDDCRCSFQLWLESDPDSELPADLAFAAVGLALLEGLKMKKREAKEAKKEEPAKPEETGDIECPICHGKHGRIKEGFIYPDFYCPDCDALITKKGYVEKAPFIKSNITEFKAWFGKMTAAKKD